MAQLVGTVRALIQALTERIVFTTVSVKRKGFSNESFTLFKKRVPLALKVRPASEQRKEIQSTPRKYSWAS